MLPVRSKNRLILASEDSQLLTNEMPYLTEKERKEAIRPCFCEVDVSKVSFGTTTP